MNLSEKLNSSSPADVAAGRSRHAAATAIAARLRDLYDAAAVWTSSPTGSKAHLRVHRLVVCFWINDSGIFFRIDDQDGGTPLMSGYLDSGRYPEHDGGSLQIMSWRRGWERSLFAPVSGQLRAIVTCLDDWPRQADTVH